MASQSMYQWKIIYEDGTTKIVEAGDMVSACEMAEIGFDYNEIICAVRI